MTIASYFFNIFLVNSFTTLRTLKIFCVIKEKLSVASMQSCQKSSCTGPASISQNRVKLHKSKLVQKWEKYPISLKWVHDLPNHNQQRISVSIEFFYTATFAKLVNNGIYKKIPKNPNIGDLVKYQAIKENSLLMNWKKLAKSIHLKRLVKRGKLKHELRVQIHEFRVQIHELQVQLVLLSFQLGLQLVTRNFVSYHITCKSMSYAL